MITRTMEVEERNERVGTTTFELRQRNAANRHDDIMDRRRGERR